MMSTKMRMTTSIRLFWSRPFKINTFIFFYSLWVNIIYYGQYFQSVKSNQSFFIFRKINFQSRSIIFIIFFGLFNWAKDKQDMYQC